MITYRSPASGLFCEPRYEGSEQPCYRISSNTPLFHEIEEKRRGADRQITYGRCQVGNNVAVRTSVHGIVVPLGRRLPVRAAVAVFGGKHNSFGPGSLEQRDPLIRRPFSPPVNKAMTKSAKDSLFPGADLNLTRARRGTYPRISRCWHSHRSADETL